MVSVLPPNASPFQVIGRAMSQLGQSAPQLLEKRYQQQQGLSAIDQLQQQLQSAGGDINQILPALAKAYTLNPSLERSGLGQQYLQQSRVGNALGQPQTQGQQQVQGQGQGQSRSQQMGQTQPQTQEIPGTPQAQPSTFATPGPFNVMTPQDIDEESTRYALKIGDPNAKSQRMSQLQNQNDTANAQRHALEQSALNSDIKPSELPRFMNVGSKFDTRNPSEWLQNTKREFQKIKANDKTLETAFIPGLGSALMGENRDKALKNLEPTVKSQVEKGLEQETRDFLEDQYLSKTEIERLIRPTPKKTEIALKKLPNGPFPFESFSEAADIFGNPFKGRKDEGLISYEEAKEKAPEYLKIMQDRLSDFFLNNINDDVSLLDLRAQLAEDKSYDWRQIGPAIREAQKKGLKLSIQQDSEMADLETQPPIQSLPDIFKDLWRIPQAIRGNR